MLACFIREHYTADGTFTPLENKALENKAFKNSANAWGSYCNLYHKTNKEASIVLSTVLL